MKQVIIVVAGIGDFLYIEAHWLFCWRYWKVSCFLAEMRQVKSHCSFKMIDLTNIALSFLFFVTYAISVTLHLVNTEGTDYAFWTDVFAPCAYVFISTLLLMYACVRVWWLLRDQEVDFSNKWMALHVVMLTLLTVF
jgi:hypothetical protein